MARLGIVGDSKSLFPLPQSRAINGDAKATLDSHLWGNPRNLVPRFDTGG